LQLCVYTPESKEDAQLKTEMQQKEQEIIDMGMFSQPHKDIELWCEETKKRFNIIPGQDFGTLPVPLHKKYLQAKCFRFFCEPHPQAGNGKFDCIPIHRGKARIRIRFRHRRV